MTTLPKLAQTMADISGREVASVLHLARMIREAGFMPTGKRGGGAASMDYGAAAHLLIALGCVSTAEAVQKVSVISSLEPIGLPIEGLPDPLQAIENARNFGDGLALLIANTPEICELFGALIESAFGDPHYTAENRNGLLRQCLLNMGPILLKIEFGGANARLAIESPSLEKIVQWERRFRANDLSSKEVRNAIGYDFRISASAGMPTIIGLWEAIEGRPLFERVVQ